MQILYIIILYIIAIILFLCGMSAVEYEEPLIGGGLMIAAVIFVIGGFALEYKVISENTFVQPVRDISATESTAETTTKPTTEPTTEPVSESTTETATLQSVVIDGKTYALVPVE